MQISIDETGNKYGRLTVIERSKTKKGSITNTFWLCRCDCGKETIANGTELRRGGRVGCGHKCKYYIEQRFKHGLSGTPEYTAWKGMLHRCDNREDNRYDDYGGRGIDVAREWRDKDNGFIGFLNYVGNRPSKDHSLDRINPNGNYEPGNVRWATKMEQANNRRKYCVISKFTTEELIKELMERGIR